MWEELEKYHMIEGPEEENEVKEQREKADKGQHEEEDEAGIVV